ncbi:hypothetical protein ACG7TL_003265 [Trametes sanguinea]
MERVIDLAGHRGVPEYLTTQSPQVLRFGMIVRRIRAELQTRFRNAYNQQVLASSQPSDPEIHARRQGEGGRRALADLKGMLGVPDKVTARWYIQAAGCRCDTEGEEYFRPGRSRNIESRNCFIYETTLIAWK